jgi:hypothetical protein
MVIITTWLIVAIIKMFIYIDLRENIEQKMALRGGGGRGSCGYKPGGSLTD